MSKSTFKEKTGYGIASLADAISYGFVGTFFLFFLTTIANITPAVAGTIVAVGAVWNAVFNPIMGYFADNISTRFGRRRPVILFFSIFLGITLFLMFTDISMPATVKPVYYGIIMVFFWSSFTGFFVPYCALGTDYASDYDERTSIRSFASFFNMVGNMFCMVMPTMIVEFLTRHGFSGAGAWSATGGFLGAISFISIVITVIVSKNKDLPCKTIQHPVFNKYTVINIFKEYTSLACLRPMKYMIAASLFSLIAYTMLLSDMIYYFTFNLRLSALQISTCLFIRALLGILLIPAVGKLSAALDKRIALIICYIVGIAGMVAVRFIEPEGFSGAMIYVLFVTICTTIYWQIIPSIYYDICEYDQVTTGKKREAMILSFQGLVEAVAAGIGGQILGAILQFAKFDGNASVQTENAMFWIENSATVVPMIFLLAACIALYKYPLTRNSSNK